MSGDSLGPYLCFEMLSEILNLLELDFEGVSFEITFVRKSAKDKIDSICRRSRVSRTRQTWQSSLFRCMEVVPCAILGSRSQKCPGAVTTLEVHHPEAHTCKCFIHRCLFCALAWSKMVMACQSRHQGGCAPTWPHQAVQVVLTDEAASAPELEPLLASLHDNPRSHNWRTCFCQAHVLVSIFFIFKCSKSPFEAMESTPSESSGRSFRPWACADVARSLGPAVVLSYALIGWQESFPGAGSAFSMLSANHQQRGNNSMGIPPCLAVPEPHICNFLAVISDGATFALERVLAVSSVCAFARSTNWQDVCYSVLLLCASTSVHQIREDCRRNVNLIFQAGPLRSLPQQLTSKQ